MSSRFLLFYHIAGKSAGGGSPPITLSSLSLPGVCDSTGRSFLSRIGEPADNAFICMRTHLSFARSDSVTADAGQFFTIEETLATSIDRSFATSAGVNAD